MELPRVTIDQHVPAGPTYQDDLNRLQANVRLGHLTSALDQVHNRIRSDVMSWGRIMGGTQTANDDDFKEVAKVVSELKMAYEVGQSMLDEALSFYGPPKAVQTVRLVEESSVRELGEDSEADEYQFALQSVGAPGHAIGEIGQQPPSTGTALGGPVLEDVDPDMTDAEIQEQAMADNQNPDAPIKQKGRRR